MEFTISSSRKLLERPCLGTRTYLCALHPRQGCTPTLPLLEPRVWGLGYFPRRGLSPPWFQELLER